MTETLAGQNRKESNANHDIDWIIDQGEQLEQEILRLGIYRRNNSCCRP